MRLAIYISAVIVAAFSAAVEDWYTLVATVTVVAAIRWWSPLTRRLRRVER